MVDACNNKNRKGTYGRPSPGGFSIFSSSYIPNGIGRDQNSSKEQLRKERNNQMSNLLAHPYELLTKEQIETSAKVRAARVNALKSTGPRTPAGKAISARNAFKHGFAGAKLTIDESEQQAFNDHLDAYFLRFKPQDQVEADAVRRTDWASSNSDTRHGVNLATTYICHSSRVRSSEAGRSAASP